MSISLPFFQHWMAGEIASFLSEKIGARVEIGRVQLGLLGRVIIDDMKVWDRQSRPLLFATRTGAQLDILKFANDGDIIVNSAQLFGVKANIQQDHPDSALNYQFIIDAFASQDTTRKPLPHIEIHSVLVRHTNINFDKNWEPSIANHLDPNHLSIKDLSLKTSLDISPDNSIIIMLDKLSFREKSGLTIKNISCQVDNTTKGGWAISNLSLSTPNSTINSPLLVYNNKLISGSLRSQLTPSDLSPLIPTLEHLDNSWSLSIEAEADSSNITVSQLDISENEGVASLIATAEIRNFRDSIPNIDADIKQLTFTSDIQEIIKPILTRNKETEPEANQKVDRLMDVFSKLDRTEIDGHLNIGETGVKAELRMANALGNIEGKGTYHKGHLEAHAKTTAFDIGKILTTPNDSTSLFGQVTAEADVKVRLSKQGGVPEGKVLMNIQEAKVKGYPYRSVILDVAHIGETYNGKLESHDPSAMVNAELRASLQDDNPYIQGFANIENFDLIATHLSSSQSLRNISTRVGIDLEGGELSNMEGHISIPHLFVSAADTTFTLTQLQLTNQPEGKLRHVNFTSPYLTMKADGEFDPINLLSYIQQLGHNWLPDVIEAPHKAPTHTDATFKINITDPFPIQYATGVELKLDNGPLNINATMQSDKQMLSALVEAPSITLKGNELQNIKANINSENQDMRTNIRMESIMKNIPVEFNLNVATKDERLSTSLTWDNHQAMRNKGEVNLRGTMERNTAGGLAVVANLEPSKVYINDTIWNVHPTQLYFRDERLFIDGFHLSTSQDERSLSIRGTASSLADDSLRVELKDIDLDYIFTIVHLKPVSFSGHVTGDVVARHVFKTPVANGNILVPRFFFNDAHMGLLNAYLSWGDMPGTLSIRGLINDTEANSTLNVNCQLHLAKDPVQHLNIQADFKRANLAFTQRYFNKFIGNMEGRASGQARIFGTFKDVDLEGEAFCHNAAFTISSLGTRYHIVEDTIHLHPGRIEFNNITAYDREGKPGQTAHSATVNGEVTHDYFRRLCFDLNFDAHHLLGYDQKDFGDMPFYATVYADGKVRLKGEPGRTDINIDATPVGKSSLTYNASGPETITKARFLSFVDRSEEFKDHKEDEKKEENKPAGDMYINFNLHLTPDVELKLLMDQRTEDAISLFGNCSNLYATYYNKGRFQMYGTYRVDHGTYRMTIQDVIRKDFRFRDGGTIVFGGSPFNADLNLKAAYTVPSVSLNDLSAKGTFSSSNVRVDCLMNIGGTPGAPRVTFDFDIPNVNEDERRMVRSLISTEEERNMQVIYLLGIGRFYTYDYSGTLDQSEVAMNSLLSSTLSDQLNQMFNSITDNTNWNFGANLSTGTMGWSNMDVEGMLSGRLLNNRLLINGSFGYRDNPVAASNFIGDFDVRYLLTKNGNIILKAYSETNDRYFTKSALTTQGAGILVKKDFTNLSDLFGFLKRKKK